MKKIAINGFGRIGRLVFRQIINNSDYKVIAINDLADAKTLAHLLKYDSAQGKFEGTIDFTKDSLVVNGQKIKVTSQRNPEDLPWDELGVEGVIESTGLFRDKDSAAKHIFAGAKKVAITAPAKGNIKTIVYSVNEQTLTSDDKIISAASCTTNALAPIVSILQKEFGIEKGLLTTVHGYTSDQAIVDTSHSDLRRGRAAAHNIIPTSTGAAAAIGKVIPELNEKLNGIAVRVPVITGSLIDLVVELKDNSVTIKDINEAVKGSANSSLAYLTDPIVSSDIIGATHGSLFDSLMTQEMNVNGKKMFKLLSWYDNESSYVSQFVKTFEYFMNL